MSRSFGARPPEEFAWQIGKTAGVIRMVNILEAQKKSAVPALVPKLQEMIDALKTGTKTLDEIAASVGVMH